MLHEPFVGMICGMPGVGKSHMALTAVDPKKTMYIDTEARSEFLITHRFNYTDEVKVSKPQTWEQFAMVFEWIRSRPEFNTLIIDSATDMMNLLEQHIREDLMRRGKGWHQTMWGKITAVVMAELRNTKAKGIDIIMTTHMRDEYVKDEPTGRKVPRINNHLQYFSDWIMLLNSDQSKGQHEYLIQKNGWAEKYKHWTLKWSPRTDSVKDLVVELAEPIYEHHDKFQELYGDVYGYHPITILE